MENLLERISIDYKVLNGKPAIKGKRIAVNSILEYLSAGDTIDDILNEYPDLEKEDILACIKFAANLMNKNFIIKEVA